MKQLWKKYGAAAVVTLFLLTALVWLCFALGGQAAKDHYYSRWIVDEPGLLSAQTEKQLAETIRELDKTYGSIMGLVVVKNQEEGSIADRAFALQQSYGFGNCDLMLLICPGSQKHYLADGDVIANYYPNNLRIALQEQITEELYLEETADSAVLQVYDTASRWYKDSVPENIGQRSQRSRAAGGTEVLVTLVLTLVAAFVLLCLVRYLFWPLFFLKTSGAWKPLWGWHILGPLKRKQKGV